MHPGDSDLFLKCRADFPSLKLSVNGYPLAYFDGPSGSQVPRQVIEAIASYYQTCNANVHGQYVTSEETDRILAQTRENLARFFNASAPSEISFGANMTTLCCFLSWALRRHFSAGDEIVITQLDHEANRGPWLRLQEQGVVVREVSLLANGTLDYQDFEAKINDRTRLIAVGIASNALGTINDIDFVKEAARRTGAWVLYDAVHFAPHFPIDVGSLGADFLLCSAYKFYGPHIGILYSRQGLLDRLDTDRLRTQDERAPYRIETGTLNHACIAGVDAALKYLASLSDGGVSRSNLLSSMEKLSRHERTLASRFHRGLSKIPGVQIYGPGFETAQRAPTVSFTVQGCVPSEVSRRLGGKGLLAKDGDFYAVRAVEILGLELSGGLVRVGISLYNTSEEVDRLLDELEALARSV
jgi:cysteine desulfurase family protein (TIGR01976 family)